VLRSTTMTELIATLDGTIVSGFRDYGVGSWEAGGDAVQAIERVVLRSARGSAFPVRVRFEPDPSGLVVETKSPATPPGHMTALSFNFGDQRYELFHPHGHAWELHSYCNDGSGADAVEVHSTNGSEHSARVRFPPTAVTPPGPDRTVPLLLGIRCQRQGWGRSPAEVMLPVHIGS
jgi:hypothetical protein